MELYILRLIQVELGDFSLSKKCVRLGLMLMQINFFNTLSAKMLIKLYFLLICRNVPQFEVHFWPIQLFALLMIFRHTYFGVSCPQMHARTREQGGIHPNTALLF